MAWIHGGAVNTRHRAERRGDQERQLVVGGWRPAEELVAGEQRGKEQKAVAAGDHGGQSTPDTGTERRGDKIGSSEEESQDV